MPEGTPPPGMAAGRVRVLVYDAASGRIHTVIANCPADMAAAQAVPGQSVLVTDQGDGGARWYIVDGALALRPTLGFDKYIIAADGHDTATLELAGPFTVQIDVTLYEAADRLEITADMPARYRVVIEDHFPFLDLDVEIVAT